MNGYIAFYNGKRTEIVGDGLTLWGAKQQAIKELKVPRKKEHMVSVMLAEKDGKPVVHTPNF